MIGFNVFYNGKSTKVAIKEDSMLIIDLYVYNGDGPKLKDGETHFYIGGVDYEERRSYVWGKNSTINMNDTFEIKVMEIDEPSASLIEEDKNIKRPMSKLEFFNSLEKKLKEKGLL